MPRPTRITSWRAFERQSAHKLATALTHEPWRRAKEITWREAFRRMWSRGC